MAFSKVSVLVARDTQLVFTTHNSFIDTRVLTNLMKELNLKLAKKLMMKLLKWNKNVCHVTFELWWTFSNKSFRSKNPRPAFGTKWAMGSELHGKPDRLTLLKIIFVYATRSVLVAITHWGNKGSTSLSKYGPKRDSFCFFLSISQWPLYSIINGKA